MKISDESKVGIFVTLSLVILFFGYSFLKGKDIFTTRSTFYVWYTQIDGLAISNPVLVNGYRVGKVDKIRFHQDASSTRILVTFSVKSEVLVPQKSIARIINADLLGSKAIELKFSDSKEYHKSRDTLLGETAMSIAATVDNIITPITSKINNIMDQVQNILDTAGSNNLSKTLENLAKTSGELAILTNDLNRSQLVKRLGEIATEIETITNTLDENKDNINTFFHNLRSLSDSLLAAQLAQTIIQSHNLITNISSITDKVNKGEGSLGQLVNNEELFRNLKETSVNLNSLTKQLNEQPGHYFRKVLKKPRTPK